MTQIQELMSILLAKLIYFLCVGPRVVVREKEVEVHVKDPNGLVRNDLALIRRYCPENRYKKGDTLAEVAYRQGMNDFLNMIETKIIARR